MRNTAGSGPDKKDSDSADTKAAPAKNLKASLKQCEDELRDAYSKYKEEAGKCELLIFDEKKKEEGQVFKAFYFKPDTFLLKEPTDQRAFRGRLVSRISGMPKPEPISYLGDEMHRAFVGIIQDRSHPTVAKRQLALFFKRRQYALQHLKYKLLNRWAHLSLTSETIEKTGSEATFMYGKLEFSLEQAIARHDRLIQDDGWKKANPRKRPGTKADPIQRPEGEVEAEPEADAQQSRLYVEDNTVPPQSMIREDDVEIFLRATTYRNKVCKVVNKFLSRLKWLPLQHRFDIFEKSHQAFKKQKELNIEKQLSMVQRVEERVKKHNIMTPEVETELTEILESSYARKYAMMYNSITEEVQNSWREDHDVVPDLINNLNLLKIKICDMAESYGLDANLEQDQGFGFSYHVTSQLPQLFQKRVIKAQFSLYDLFATEDRNELAKTTLSNMSRVDTNIFRDISTARASVPSDQSLAYELRNSDIRVMRLKSAQYWVDYICLTPTEPEWHKKQQALLSNNNPIDSLMRSGMNFLDVHDLASVNRLNEDNAILHQQAVKKLHAHNPHNQIKVKVVTSSNGDRKTNYNLTELKSMSNEAEQLDKHLLGAVQGQGIAAEMGQGKTEVYRPAQEPSSVSRAGLKATPHHLLVSYYTLRFMQSKDAKTRILYCLNFFRAIQKRISLDLREFGTRERMNSYLAQPFIHSSDANKHIVNKANYTSGVFDNKSQSEGKRSSKDLEAAEKAFEHKMTVFDDDVIKDMKDMATLRLYKCNGTFNNQIFSTCPSFPKFHCTFGEPVQKQSADYELEHEKSKRGGVSEKSLKLMGRIDKIELNEALEEVYVKDDFGVYIMYDCVLQDMKGMEEEILKIASYYLQKAEVLQDVHSEKPQPGKDRLEMLDDLLMCESKFQYRKVKLVMAYMECYEHVVDPLEQQRLMQIITDIKARRPRLNLNAYYFKDAYAAEIQCLEKQLELVQLLIDYQVNLEKSENKRLQDALSLSYTLSNEYEKNRWKYQDAETLLQAVIRKRRARKVEREYAEHGTTATIASPGRRPGDHASPGETSPPGEGSVGNTLNSGNITEQQDEDIEDESELSEMSEMKILKAQENVFQQLLGLPEISIESLYMQYKEKDKDIIRIMNEQTNFITIHEGYPEFLNNLQGGSGSPAMKSFKPCPWSQDTANLDFYDSLDFINKFYAITEQIQQELYDALKPHDTSTMTYIDMQVTEFALKEYRQVLKFMDGSEQEYTGRQYFEDESVLGSPDKMVFLAREMLSQLTLSAKHTLDPFLIAKLDLNTINFFEFSKLTKPENKYSGQYVDGCTTAEWVMKAHRRLMVENAKKRASAAASVNIEHIIATTQAQVSGEGRNIKAPSLLELFCNGMELLRLRNEIILAMSECQVLRKVYEKQIAICKKSDAKVSFENPISFEELEAQEEGENDLINFVDEGPAHHIEIGLDVREYDPSLVSNLNFRAPDSFKLCVTTAGLEEVRAVLRYQLLQKHLLIVATRANQLMMDNCLKALSEVRLLEPEKTAEKISIPNSTISILDCFSKNADQINQQNLRNIRAKFASNMSSVVSQVFFNVIAKKNQHRTIIAKEYSMYQSKVLRQFLHKTQCVQRVMRSFRIKQMTKYSQNILTEVHLEAQKIQGIQVCQRLRDLSHYFDFDMVKLGMTASGNKASEVETCQVFVMEQSNMIENFTAPYMPAEESVNLLDESEVSAREVKVVSPEDLTILNHRGIPSSMSLMKAEAATPEEIAKYRKRHKEIYSMRYGKDSQVEELKSLDPGQEDPEASLKPMIECLTLLDGKSTYTESQRKKKLREERNYEISHEGYVQHDYEEALDYSDSNYAKFIRYYQSLERIITLEWFIYKLQFRQNDIVHLDNAITNGLPFWQSTEYEQRLMSEVPQTAIKEGYNKFSQNFLYERIVTMRTKKDIADELSSLSMGLKNVIKRFQDTPEHRQFEFLNSYTEFKYMQIVGSIHKLIDQFYTDKKDPGTIKTLKKAVQDLTKTSHLTVSYPRANSYHVNTALVHPQFQFLESSNLIYGAFSEDEHLNFAKCVRPVVNEKALEPPQVTLFQSLYQTDYFRKHLPTQFAGQLVSTHNSVSFPSLQNALLNLSHEQRQYCQSFVTQTMYVCNDYMETVLGTGDSAMTREKVYSIAQLGDAKGFLSTTTAALLLKQAVMCWTENMILPDDPHTYEKWEKKFRSQFFWKIIEEKDEMLSKKRDLKIPTKAQLKELAQKITDLQDNYSLSTMDEEVERDKMIAVLREEFASMKKKVTIDNSFTTTAEIEVLRNEIEKHLCRAAIQTLEDETTALLKCFDMSVAKVRYHIHPCQQFAGTFFDQVDHNCHLNLEQKLAPVQQFLTELRNRGTGVSTLTSGKGWVFTEKDINACIAKFCRQVIKYGEAALKSRTDEHVTKERHFARMLYIKDQKLADMQRRLDNTGKNLDNLISAKLFEKGNQLIYQLDCTSRILILFKQTMFGLETELRNKILGEQAQKFKLQKDELDCALERFAEYKKHIQGIVQVDFGEGAEALEKAIKLKAEEAKEIGPNSTYKNPQLYPGTGTHKVANSSLRAGTISLGTSQGMAAGSLGADGRLNLTQAVGTLAGTLVPPGFRHEAHCICYKPDPSKPNPTIKYAELDMLSQQKARLVLAHSIDLMRKQKLFWRMKEMLMQQKYQNKINLMKKQLSNNSYLWDQMAEAEKREKVLKQELLFTQQSRTKAEKVIEKLQEEMKTVEADRQRLYKYKHSQTTRLKELEDKIKKFQVFDNIDLDKLLQVLERKDKEVTQLRSVADTFSAKIDIAERRKDQEVSKVKQSLQKEQVKTQQIVEKMDQMKLELKMLESNDSSVAAIWKKKCLDLFEVCQTLKTENEELRDRCKDLITQGIQLADAMNSTENQTRGLLSSQDERDQVQLPDLLSRASVQGMNQNQANKQMPGTAGITSGRHASTAGTYEAPSTQLDFHQTPSLVVQHRGFDIPSEMGQHGPDDLLSDGAFQAPFSQQNETAHGPRVGKKSLAPTLRSNNFGLTTGQMAGFMKSPQQQYMLAGPNIPGRGRDAKNGAPKTSQHARGRSIGAAGPTYHMPQSTQFGKTQVASRNSQKPAQRSLMATARETKNESTFNQSFYVSQDANVNAATLDHSAKTQKRGGQAAYDSLDMTAASLVAGQQNTAIRTKQGFMPDDSLFESSKASTGYQTALINKRQFQGRNAQGAKSIGVNTRKADNYGQTGLQSVRGAKPQGAVVTGRAAAQRIMPDTLEAEASFAAQNGQRLDNQNIGGVSESAHLQKYVQEKASQD